jgi:hypothetical protein
LEAPIRLAENDAEWVDVWSGSKRTGRLTPTGGFVGRAVWRGGLGPYLPLLRCGEVVHVGKNAVKGDGWYRIDQVE